MYKLVPWSDRLDLTDFYQEATNRNLVNNASQRMLVDCFQNEQAWAVWMLYYNDTVVGSVASHSLPELGPTAYRICARTCVFTNLLPITHIRTLSGITEHQNITAQFFIPQCVKWAGADKDLYITSHPSDVGTQRLVHNIFCPALVKTGVLERACELEYRGHLQTLWRLNVPVFLEQLKHHPAW